MIIFIMMFICNLLVPAMMLVGGCFMYKKPPKNINQLIGYRTKMSKKNMDTWVFAHKYCGKLWIVAGAIILVISAAVQIPFVHADDDTIGLLTLVLMGVQLAVLLCSILPVEKALKNKFDENGIARK